MTQINNKPRQSNIELLRIISIFLILVVHANFKTLGAPTEEELFTTPINVVVRFLIQSVSIVCVNVFVLISGYFGIKPSIKKISGFYFQCVFLYLCFYTFAMMIEKVDFKITTFLNLLTMRDWLWFVPVYFGLYIVSPILNTFAETTKYDVFVVFLITFFSFQTFFGWICQSADFLLKGYSVTSFVGLYLVGRFIKRFNPNIMLWKKSTYISLILGTCIFITLLSVLLLRNGIPYFHSLYSYISPFVIFMSIMWLALFLKIRLNSKLVNFIGVSSFAAVLIHTNIYIGEWIYTAPTVSIYKNYHGIECLLYIGLYLIGLFVFSCLIDKIRIFAWHQVEKLI